LKFQVTMPDPFALEDLRVPAVFAAAFLATTFLAGSFLEPAFRAPVRLAVVFFAAFFFFPAFIPFSIASARIARRHV
jgi:hypothetical protein